MARAPGRLDVMGGIADYSGSLVLQVPALSLMVISSIFICTDICENMNISVQNIEII